MKNCKPNYRMQHFEGCGEPSLIFKYGSCLSCFRKWVRDTEEGAEWAAKQGAYKNKKNKAQEERERRKRDKELKIEIMSTTKYWSTILQPKINKIARLIDFNCPCIATDRDYGQIHGGHYHSVGSNRTTSLNLHNIFAQTAESNKHQGGDSIKFRKGLLNTFGEQYTSFIDELPCTPSLHLTKLDLQEFENTAKIILKKLEKMNKDLDRKRNPSERIELRNWANETLGVYTDEFAIFLQ